MRIVALTGGLILLGALVVVSPGLLLLWWAMGRAEGHSPRSMWRELWRGKP